MGPFLALLHVVLALSASVDSSETADESDYIGAGWFVLETGNWEFTSASFHPPLSYYLNSTLLWLFHDIPDSTWHVEPAVAGRVVAYDRQVGESLLYRSGYPARRILFFGRLPIAIASGVLVLLVWAWASEWLGRRAATLSTTLAAFCPNLLAHAAVVTTDTVLAATYFGASYAFWRFFRRPTLGRLAVVSGTVTLAVLSKVPGLFLVPTFVLLFLVRHLGDPGFDLDFRYPLATWARRGRLRKAMAGAFVATTVGTILGFPVFWGAYHFSTRPFADPSHRPHRQIDRRIPEAFGLREGVYAVLESPLPAPAYQDVLRMLVGHSEMGHHAYLLGQRSMRGWWYYFPVAVAVKTPLPTLALAATGFLLLLAGRARGRGGIEILLLAVVAFAPALFSSIQIGVRHVLHFYPFLHVVAGAVVATGPGPSRRRVGLAVLAATAAVLASCATYPHYLAFFNSAAGGPRGGHRFLSDSNLDWGQDRIRLAEFQERASARPLAAELFFHVAPEARPAVVSYEESWRGLVALGVTARHGQYDRSRPDRFAGFDPAQALVRVGHSIEIYEAGGSPPGR